MGLEVELSIELERIMFEDYSKYLSHMMFRTRRVVEIFGIRSSNRFQYPRFVVLTCKKTCDVVSLVTS